MEPKNQTVMGIKKIIRDWEYLPEGVLEMIMERLAAVDCVSFGNVCKNWRSIVTNCKPSRVLPWLVMSGRTRTKARSFFSVLEHKSWLIQMPKSSNRGFVWGSFEDWLILVEPVGRDWDIRIALANPFSGAEFRLPDVKNNRYHKLVLSTYPGDDNCMYMLVNSFRPSVAIWITEAQDWCECEVSGDNCVDVISFNGCFYLLTADYNIKVLDVAYASSKLKEKRIKTKSFVRRSVKQMETKFYKLEMCHDTARGNNRKVRGHLFEMGGEIHLVCRLAKTKTKDAYVKTYDFKIYKLDLCKACWVKVEDIGDHVIFVGRSCSRSFAAKELGLGIAETNCVYFTNELTRTFGPIWMNEWECPKSRPGSEKDDWGIFRLDSKDGFSYQGKDRHTPFWVTAPLWWYFRHVDSQIKRKKDLS